MRGISQSIVWRLEVLAYDLLSLFLRLFPFAWVSAFGGALLKLIGPLSRKHHIVLTGLRTAFPEKSEHEIKAIALAQWENTGRTFAEFPLMHRIRPFAQESRVTVVGLEKLHAHHPAIIVTGHFANWEVMATVLTQSNLPVRITYRKINNPYMDRRIRQQRERYGTRFLVQKSGHKGGRELFKALDSGDSVALLNDQKFNEGLSLPFFGKPAMTAPGATRLALKTGLPLLPISVTRQGSRFTVTLHDPIPLESTGHREKDVQAGVEKIITFTEDYIRTHPDQWFWVHRRWPKEHYKRG